MALAACVAAIAAFSLLLQARTANAMQIQRVVSSKGIEAWLVEDRTLPLFTMHFAFTGGSTQDPAAKPGVSYFVSGMLDEGSGDLDSQAFRQRVEELAMRLNFEAGMDHFSASFQALTANRAESLKLLKSALTAPRFESEDMERIRTQIMASLRAEAKDPDRVAALEWSKLAFGSHPYSRPAKGTLESVPQINSDDLRQFVQRNLARGNLKVAVVGDIDATALKAALDEVFGSLPEKAQLNPVPDVSWPAGVKRKVVTMPNPQSVAQFGLEGLKRNDPDFIPAYILNYIMGGGGFASKLIIEVREKRGLAYSVYTYLNPLDHGGILAGSVATENKAVGQSLDVIVTEFARAAKEGVSEADLRNAKDYLIGSFALRFDTSGKVAGQLLSMQLDNLGIDYLQKRNALIEAVSVDDIKRVAKRLLNAGNLIVTVAGQPDGITETGL
jgi:zinc protease